MGPIFQALLLLVHSLPTCTRPDTARGTPGVVCCGEGSMLHHAMEETARKPAESRQSVSEKPQRLHIC